MKQSKAHKHEYIRDTREWAKQDGGRGYLCRICGFRIPENLESAARNAGAKFVEDKTS